jgi:hypothetical protein
MYSQLLPQQIEKKYKTRTRTTHNAVGPNRFLGTFAKLRKVAISFVMSVCLSVRSDGTVRLPLGRF